MANQKQDILSRLADKGEGALTRVAGSQTTALVVGSIHGVRGRMDYVQMKLRGRDELVRRGEKLVRQLAELHKPKAKPKTTRTRSASSPARKSTAKKTPS